MTAAAIQIVTAGLALAGLSLAPPARGAMVLVPVTPAAAVRLAAFALDDHALLIAAGPLPGSLVVSGERRLLAAPMLRPGVLTLAAPFAGCSGPSRR